MSDMPSFSVLQQAHARPFTGSELESFGKQAAAHWANRTAPTLHEAVVMTVKSAGLSPEQVRRVVEFTNSAAYLREFTKEGSTHKYIDFGPSGPANPSDVLKDLNDGGGGSVFDSGDDYATAPVAKTASANDDNLFFEKDAHPDVPTDPLRDVTDLYAKLASRKEQLEDQYRGLSGMFADLGANLAFHVKQAALEGHPLSEIVDIFENFTEEPEHIKAAFAAVMDPLLESRVFYSPEELAASFEKEASAAGSVPDPGHPMVVSFREFTEVLDKLAELNEEYSEVKTGHDQLLNFIRKEAASGILPKAMNALHGAANVAERGGAWAGKHLLGPQHAEAAGAVAKGLTYAAPLVAGYEGYRRNLKYNPGFQSAKRTAFSVLPGTQEHYNKELELQSQNPYAMMGGY